MFRRRRGGSPRRRSQSSRNAYFSLQNHLVVKDKILIYGALGYTGNLFVTRAMDPKLPMVLGARSQAVKALAQQHGVEYRIFDISNAASIQPFLSDVKILVNFANIAFAVNRPLLEACIASGTHYIDLASEYDDLSEVCKYHPQALEKGVMLLPGSGFNLIPTDIAATIAHQHLPDASRLTIGYAVTGNASRGTIKTVLKDAVKTGFRREKNNLVPDTSAKESITLSAEGKTFSLINNATMGETITCWESTKIPTITTYSYFPWIMIQFMKGRLNWLRKFLLRHADTFFPVGPSDKEHRTETTYSWASVENEKNEKVQVTVIGPEAYLFTVLMIQEMLRRMHNGAIKPGFVPPSFFGRGLLDAIHGVEIMVE